MPRPHGPNIRPTVRSTGFSLRLPFRHSIIRTFGFDSSFVIRHSNFQLLILLLIALTLPLTSCGKSEDPTIPEVLVVSPHGSDIRREFERGFSTWHQKKYGSPAKVRWPDIGGGGTGNIIKQLSGDYKTRDTSGYDIVFGGGSHTYEVFRAGGYIVKPPLDDAILAKVPKEIYSTPLHGEGDVWIAATLSNFGISYNIERVKELGLPRRTRGKSSPAPSGLDISPSQTLPSPAPFAPVTTKEIFLQHGWEKGWKIMTHLFANTDQMREAGSAPSADVGSAQAVAGIVIDFYGRKEILRIGDRIVGFIIPPGGSVVDPDPIAMLKGHPNPKIAARFIEFVISEEGQKLWVFKAGTPGGPDHYVLGRLSVLPELYKNFPQHMFDPKAPSKPPSPSPPVRNPDTAPSSSAS